MQHPVCQQSHQRPAISAWVHGGSINGGTPKLAGWLISMGKSQSKMDDDWGTPILGNRHVVVGQNAGTLGSLGTLSHSWYSWMFLPPVI